MADLGPVFTPNLLSPFDVSQIVESLVELRRKIITDPLTQRKNLLQERVGAVSRLKSLVISMLSSAQILASSTSYKVFRASLSNLTGSEDPKNILSASASSDAVQGVFDVQVNQIAQAWKVGSNIFSSADVTLSSLGISSGDKIVIKGVDTANAKVLNLDPNWTLKQLRDKINEMNVGLTAYIVNSGGGVQLVISASKTGEGREFISLANASGTPLQTLGFTTGGVSLKHNFTTYVTSDFFTKNDVAVGQLVGFSAGQAPSGTITVNGNSVSIDLNTMSLQDIKSAIESAAGAGSADVISDGGGFRLKINSTNVGWSDAGGLLVLETLGIMAEDFQNVVLQGKNAQIVIDGSQFSSPDNVFSPSETGITGITFNVLRASSDVIRVTVERDIDRIVGYAKNLVENWNKVVDFMREQARFDENKKSAGPLSGDFSLIATNSAMLRAFSGIIEFPQADGSFKRYTLSSLGFSIDREGKLSLSESKLREALMTDFDGAIYALTSVVNQKIQSGLFSSDTSPLNFSGEMLIEGKSIVVNTSDTLRDIALKINNAMDSVRAYVREVSGKYQLVVEKVGGGLPSLVEVSGNLLLDLQLASNSFKIKNQVNFTAVKTDLFFSDSSPVRNSLDSDTSSPDTVNGISGNIVIPLYGGGTISVSIDISSNSLQDIANNINSAAGGNIASVRSVTTSEGTKYYIEISGVDTDPTKWGGSPNLLQFLGLVKRDENKVSVHKGFAESLRINLSGLIGIKGEVTSSEDRFNRELTGVDTRLSRIEEELENYRVSLYTRWARANQLMQRTRRLLFFFQSIFSSLVQAANSPVRLT